MGLEKLLAWTDEIVIKNPRTGEDINVYFRVIGDTELTAAYKYARVESSRIRNLLKDPDSIEYKDMVEPLKTASREDCLRIIEEARTSNLDAEARSNVVRPDEPRIDEIAVDPDAPTLEEQEKLDAEIERVDKEYQEALEEYTKVRKQALVDSLKDLPDDEIRQIAVEEVSTVMALGAFLGEVLYQKTWRGSYLDKEFTQRAFDTVDGLKNAPEEIRDALVGKYITLEIAPDEIKN